MFQKLNQQPASGGDEVVSEVYSLTTMLHQTRYCEAILDLMQPRVLEAGTPVFARKLRRGKPGGKKKDIYHGVHGDSEEKEEKKVDLIQKRMFQKLNQQPASGGDEVSRRFTP